LRNQSRNVKIEDGDAGALTAIEAVSWLQVQALVIKSPAANRTSHLFLLRFGMGTSFSFGIVAYILVQFFSILKQVGA